MVHGLMESMKLPKREIRATEDGWLTLRRGGMTVQEIADECGQPYAAVHEGISRARMRERRRPEQRKAPWKAVPLFPLDSFTPHSRCPHHGPIRPYSSFVCMVCHATGRDNHPLLQRDPRTDPAPAPKPDPPTNPLATRKERRALMVEWLDV